MSVLPSVRRPVEEDTVKIMHDNQQRMREGPQSVRGINPRVMQARPSSASRVSHLLLFRCVPSQPSSKPCPLKRCG